MTLSILGKKWLLAQSTRTAALAQSLALPEIVARVLDIRQPQADTAALLEFLTPKLSQLPDPSHFLDMDKAVARIAQALHNKENIAVFGDYDVDGAYASAMLLRYLRALGVQPKLYIPDRLTEGYGPMPLAMDLLADSGVNLLITVDCGSTAHPALERAKERGMDVIVTDHHQAPLPLPPCVALVNPNRVDEQSACTMLCGAGLAFFLLMALNRKLRKDGFFQNMKEPDLRDLLDLVAVATVCDLVPLIGVNRILVSYGLQTLNGWKNTGLRALAEVSGLQEEATPYTAGFQIGPRLNAAGRLSGCSLGATLLSMEDEEEAAKLAERLNKLNTTRKEVQTEVCDAALQLAEAQANETAIVVAGQGWHPGVVGIVAARVKEAFYRPTFVLSLSENGTATGSGRSITGVDIGQAVHASMGTLVRGGGHGMAAGITVEQANIDDFTTTLRAQVNSQISGEEAFVPTQKIDAVMQPASLSVELIEQLNQLAPYGSGHREPTFALSGVVLQDARMVGADKTHAKLSFMGADGSVIGGICFGAGENGLGDFFHAHKGQKVSVVGRLSINTYNGFSKPDMQVMDAVAGSWVA